MASEHALRIVGYLFATTLVALVSVQAAVAEKTHPHARAVAKPAAGSADRHDPSKGRDRGPRTQNANPIDTSITVLPRHPSGAKADAPFGKQGIRVAPTSPPRPHRIPGPTAGQPAPRNAIGMPVVPRQPAGVSRSSPFGLRAVSPPVTPSMSGSLAHGSGTIGAMSRNGASANPVIRPVAPPSRIGGPAIAVGGINGATFRTKHR
jgi:hypothetical protein